MNIFIKNNKKQAIIFSLAIIVIIVLATIFVINQYNKHQLLNVVKDYEITVGDK